MRSFTHTHSEHSNSTHSSLSLSLPSFLPSFLSPFPSRICTWSLAHSQPQPPFSPSQHEPSKQHYTNTGRRRQARRVSYLLHSRRGVCFSLLSSPFFPLFLSPFFPLSYFCVPHYLFDFTSPSKIPTQFLIERKGSLVSEWAVSGVRGKI